MENNCKNQISNEELNKFLHDTPLIFPNKKQYCFIDYDGFHSFNNQIEFIIEFKRAEWRHKQQIADMWYKSHNTHWYDKWLLNINKKVENFKKFLDNFHFQ